MLKRFALVACVVAVMLLLMVGCDRGGAGDTPADVTTPAPVTPEQPIAPAPELVEPDYEVVFDDPNVNTPGTFPVLREPMTLTVGVQGDSTNPSWQGSYVTDWLFERTNVNIEWDFFPTGGGDARQALELLVASNSRLPDVLLGILNEPLWNTLGAQQFLVELTPFFERQGHFFFEKAEYEGFDIDWLFRYARSPDGGLYGVPALNYAPQNYYANRAWIATPFLDALGMDMPETYDQLLAFLRGVRDNDLNGTGRNDEIGILGSTNGWNANPLSWLQNMFIYRDMTDDHWYIGDDGNLTVAFIQPEYQEFLIFARMMADEGLLDPLSFTQNVDAQLSLITAEDLVVAIPILGGVGGFGPNLPYYEPLNIITGPNGLRVSSFQPPFAQPAAFITSWAESPEAAFAFLMAGFSDPHYDVISRFGQPGLDWEPVTEDVAGLFDFLGVSPTFRNLRGDIRFIPDQTSVWGGADVRTLPRLNRVEMFQYVDLADPINRGQMLTSQNLRMHLPYARENVVTRIVFTEDEMNRIQDQRATIRSFVSESAARFVVGDLNPVDDWDWFNRELERMRLSELIEISNAAWQRTTAN